ncbi:hypothetical protein B0H34DRAFT_793188 [Crassisporium funariophilum]|nr:hypothetical protein B0H34DRAFT_793188 [Crassisporium funariophilum]
MSADLDADLYGDLYGNDEGDIEQPQEEHDDQADQAQAEAAPLAAPEQFAIKTHVSTGESNYTNGAPSQMASTNGLPISSYSQQPAPQKIPTYEEPQPTDYRETPQPRADGGYSNIPVNERSVRPSEMKDEG